VTIQPGGCKTVGVRKASPLQISFCISILIHVLVLGVYAIIKSSANLPTFHQEESSIALTWDAAPKAAVVQPTTFVAPVQPVEKPAIQHLSENPAVKVILPEMHPVAPVPLLRSLPVTTAKPVVQPSVPSNAHSPVTGENVTTVQVQPGSKAKPDDFNNRKPVYPESAQRRHEQGLVLLAVTVTAQGQVAAVEIKNSSHFPLLDDAALEAVRHWNFEPARLGPIAFQSEIDVPIRFELRQ
jgi:periplasmic protein TonB